MENYLTFAEYLSELSSGSSSNCTFDYGLYLRDIAAMRKVAHVSSTLMFLLDYKSMSYPFMDVNVAQVIGHPLEAYQEGGLEFSLYHNQHFSLLNKEIFDDRWAFFSKVDNEALPNIRCTMGFGYKDAKGNVRSILQRHLVTELTENKHPKGIFGFCWDITDESPNARVFHEIEVFDHTKNEWCAILTKRFFPGIDPGDLFTKREIEILKWMSAGLVSKQIADRLHVSKLTIDTHRKNMFYKTNCKTIAELVVYATRIGII